jgi:hypothetical protein
MKKKKRKEEKEKEKSVKLEATCHPALYCTV